MSNRRIRKKKETNRSFTPEELEQIERDYIVALKSDNHWSIRFWKQVEKYARKTHKREKSASVAAMLEKDTERVF